VRTASRLLVAAPLALTLSSPPIRAAEPSREQIDSLRTQIQATVKTREQLEQEQEQARKDLQQQELELAQATSRLEQLREQLHQSRQRLTELTQRADTELNALNAQREWLAHVIRAQYLSGEKDTIKLLLRQSDTGRLQRVMTYHEIITRKRIQTVADATKSLGDTRLVAESVRLESSRLQSLTAEQTRAAEEIKALRAAREKTIATLGAQISETNRSLEALRADKRALEKLLYSLPSTPPKAVGADTKDPATAKGLADRKGRLPWPVDGKISNPFTDGANAERHHGVYIAAETGKPVNAIEAGIVRFADWFQGFGLLVIIDHGDGYISLYGHNQTLATRTGDTVRAGQAIAAVGNTGGQGHSGLYFAIRHNGRPQDPAEWCH
jgi:septal ring factor EnvC (AmiA/AmiB activator)